MPSTQTPSAADIAKAKANLKKKAAAAYSRSKTKPSEVKKGGGGVPAPLDHAACQFVGYEFKPTEKGDPSFGLKFVILEPEEHAGRQFYLWHFINENEYNTLEDATDRLTSDIQLIGGEGCTANTESTDDLFPILDQCAQDKPFMEFHSWVHTFGKKSKKAGEKENRAALDGCIDQDYDPDWYKALLDISKEMVEQDDDEAGDPEPPKTSRTRGTAQTNGQAATPAKAAAPARNSRSAAAKPEPAKAEAAPATRASGRRAAAATPAPEPDPEPEADPDQYIPQVDDIMGLEVDVEVGTGRNKKTEQQVWEVTITAVDEAAGTVDLVDANGGVYEAVPFDELKDPPAQS